MTNESDEDPKVNRMSKRQFVSRLAKRADVPHRVALQVYEAFTEELLEVMGSGTRLTLTGLGKFYTQEHKGHEVRNILSGESAGSISDYTLLKFTATRDVNKQIGEALKNNGAKASGRG